MLNTLKNLPEDPSELRQVSELLAAEVKALTLKVEQLQHQLHGANRHRFGSTSESMDQLQLFVENEEIAEAATDVVDITPPEPIEPKAKPKRKLSSQHAETLTRIEFERCCKSMSTKSVSLSAPQARRKSGKAIKTDLRTYLANIRSAPRLNRWKRLRRMHSLNSVAQRDYE